MSNDPKTQPVHIGGQGIIFETGGVKFLIQQIIDPNPPPNPPPPNPVTPVTPIVPPQPPIVEQGGIGPDGIKLMFAENKQAKAKPFYLNLDKPDSDNDHFATTYGSKVYKFKETKTDGKVKYVVHEGAKQTYASGAPPGKSCRFHHNPAGGMDKVGKHSWKDKPLPEFLYDPVAFYNFEFSVIARVGKPLGTHQSFAFKVRSRPDKPDDSLRSTVEFCMPNDQKGDAYFNYNYDHKTYAKVSGVKQYFKEGKIIPNQWIGVKVVSIIADDRKSTWFGMYVDTDPLDANTGQPKNNWKLKAEYTAKGIPEYKNIPPVWAGMTDYLRVDGYENVDLARFSIVEILKGPLKDQQTLQTAPDQKFAIAAPDPDPDPAAFNDADDEEHIPQQDPTGQQPPQTQVNKPVIQQQ